MLDNYRLTPEIQRYPRSETWDRTQKYADLYTRFSLVKKNRFLQNSERTCGCGPASSFN